MGTGDKNRPETLLAGMDTALADLIVPAAAVLPQEEGPLQPPLLAPAVHQGQLILVLRWKRCIQKFQRQRRKTLFQR